MKSVFLSYARPSQADASPLWKGFRWTLQRRQV
jgi:hypothetical protein